VSRSHPRRGCTYLSGAPLLVAHRGGSKIAPENTLEAFEQAVVWWEADMLEMDVRLTADGEVVVIHDATVDRTTDGTGMVADLSLSEIQALDAGYHFHDPSGVPSFRGRGVAVPRFEDVLTALPHTRINVEPKEPQAAAPLVELIRRHEAEQRVLVAAEFERSRRDVRDYQGPWGASRHHVFWFWLTHRLPFGGPYAPGADILQVPQLWKGLRIVSPRFIEAAHARNLPVQVWTVDDPDDMRRLLEWGVDGIQSDRPDLLAEVLSDLTGRPPPPGLSGAQQ
jgi:glycerophosphoryl diester phosphodiesterase